jgi:hypothetical protein
MWPFVPHLFHYWDTISPHDDDAYWLDMDLVWLECCHVFLRLSGGSLGAGKEERWATERGIPVYHEGNGGTGLADLIAEFQSGRLWRPE